MYLYAEREKFMCAWKIPYMQILSFLMYFSNVINDQLFPFELKQAKNFREDVIWSFLYFVFLCPVPRALHTVGGAGSNVCPLLTSPPLEKVFLCSYPASPA